MEHHHSKVAVRPELGKATADRPVSGHGPAPAVTAGAEFEWLRPGGGVPEAAQVLAAQRAIGNLATGRLLAERSPIQREDEPVADPAAVGAGKKPAPTPGPGRQIALLSAVSETIDLVGDRLIRGLGKQKEEGSGPSLALGLLSYGVAGTVAGVIATKLVGTLVTEFGRAALVEFFSDAALDATQRIAASVKGVETVDLWTFVTAWKDPQKEVLIERMAQVASGRGGQQTDLELALATAGMRPGGAAEVADVMLRDLLSLFLRAVRDKITDKEMSNWTLPELSGAGYVHMKLVPGNKSSVHCDLIDFDNADLKLLSRAFKQNGVNVLETPMPVVLTIQNPYRRGSDEYRYETWWLFPLFGEIVSDKEMQYTDDEKLDRKPGGNGMTRNAKGELWSLGSAFGGFGHKLPIPAGFGGSVPIKGWLDIQFRF